MRVGDFSDLVLRLTSSALERRPRDHQGHLIELLKGVVRFDAAWWGWSSFAAARITLVQTGFSGVSASFESAFRAVAHQDPFIHHGRNLPVFAKSIEIGQPDLRPDYRNFLIAFDIGSILNGHCRLGGDAEFNFFMSLYRRRGSPAFSPEETADFRIILQHLEQSLSLSLRAEMRAHATTHGEAALLAADGAVVRATRGFRASLAQDGLSAAAIRRVLTRLASGDARWHGNAVTLDASAYGPGLVLLRLLPRDGSAVLSAGESRVAQAIIAGRTMRQVAQAHQVSLNTVRNQVAAIYRKLGCHNRMDLARALGRDSPPT